VAARACRHGSSRRRFVAPFARLFIATQHLFIGLSGGVCNKSMLCLLPLARAGGGLSLPAQEKVITRGNYATSSTSLESSRTVRLACEPAGPGLLGYSSPASPVRHSKSPIGVRPHENESVRPSNPPAAVGRSPDSIDPQTCCWPNNTTRRLLIETEAAAPSAALGVDGNSGERMEIEYQFLAERLFFFQHSRRGSLMRFAHLDGLPSAAIVVLLVIDCSPPPPRIDLLLACRLRLR
jgi:hypothetical protein